MRFLLTAVFVLNLDAPRAPAPEAWTLVVTVGQTRYLVPRAELKRLVVAHPEWIEKETQK